MDSLRKRRHDDGADLHPPEVLSTLVRLRNMWQFASLCQWFYIFGGVVKLDNLDIDDLEVQCLSPHSTVLQDIGLALLKYLSSHRGLTAELFDEYTRRQFATKAPELPNPFGNDEVPARFASFSIFQKIRILHQMTSFVMMNAEKLREKMAEQKDADQDQTTWRIEPFGWDRDDRAYFVLDDNRVYRLTEAPPAPPKPKKNTKKARALERRREKRRRVSSTTLGNAAEVDEDRTVPRDDQETHATNDDIEGDINDGLGGMTWECVAVSLDELRSLLASISSKKDPNERVLHEKLVEHLLPILEQQEERRKKREKEHEKALLNLAKMANAKRSSRIAGRQEQQKQEEMLREEEQKRRFEIEALRKQEQRQRKAEKEREARLLSRENRLNERENRRARHKYELAQLSEDGRSVDNAVGRISERRRQAEIEKNKEALRDLGDELEDEWTFDCICGLHGKIDDGQHSVSCEKCSIWQHSRCLGIDEKEAEKDDFHFVCDPCKRSAATVADGQPFARPVIRIKINAPVPEKPTQPTARATDYRVPVATQSVLPNPVVPTPASTLGSELDNDDADFDAYPQEVARAPVLALPEAGNGIGTVPGKVDGVTTLPRWSPNGHSSVESGSNPMPWPTRNEHTNPFAAPHPGLSQPDQSPRKSHAYGTIYEQPVPPPVLPHSLQSQPMINLDPLTPTAATSTCRAQPLPAQLPPTALATPRLQHRQEEGLVAEPLMQSSPSLLPSSGGMSPTKHSRAASSDQTAVLPRGSPVSISIPPSAALSPSTPQQILVPPVKPEGLAHRQSFSNIATDQASQPRANLS